MNSWLIKLTLAPALIGCVSLAQRRWGPSIGGFLGGLPLTVGPALYVLALENGAPFAAAASISAVQSLVAVAAFSAAYAVAAVRWRQSWLRSTALAFAVYLAAMGLVTLLPQALLLAVVLAALAILLAFRWMPGGSGDAAPKAPPPVWDLPLRMVAAVALVLTVSALAQTVGARVSGLLTPFPIPALILGAFTHRHDGPNVAAGLLRSLVLGLSSREAFCAVSAAALPAFGMAGGFVLAVLCTIAVQGALWWLWQRRRVQPRR